MRGVGRGTGEIKKNGEDSQRDVQYEVHVGPGSSLELFVAGCAGEALRMPLMP